MTHQLEHLTPPAQRFLDAVRRHLDDLSPSDQADLLEQVELRLRDLDASGNPDAIEAILGPPARLAHDLRTSAGYPPATSASPGRAAPSTLDNLRDALNHPLARPVTGYLTSLRPAWWAVRGYIVVAGILAGISQGGGYRLHTIGSYKDALVDTTQAVHFTRIWLLIPIAAIIASITAGMLNARLPRAGRLLITGLNIATVILIAAYPTWWLAPAFAYYTGLVN